MEHCPICGESLQDALVVCGHCGEVLPLRVLMVSEGSHGGGFALVENADEQSSTQEEVNGE